MIDYIFKPSHCPICNKSISPEIINYNNYIYTKFECVHANESQFYSNNDFAFISFYPYNVK